MENEIELTILIPALNEETTIEIVIKKAQKWIQDNNVRGEVLISNNNSIDNTKQIAINNKVRVIDVEKRGYGNAIIEGIKQANGKYIIIGDADDSYNFLEINEFIDNLDKGYDLVIGNRYYHMEKGAMKFLHKYIGTPLLTYILNKKYNLKLHDINCGLRAFKKDKILSLNLNCEGMEFASEMIVKAKKAELNIKEIPINFYKDKRNRKSHLNTIKDGFKHVKVIMSF